MADIVAAIDGSRLHEILKVAVVEISAAAVTSGLPQPTDPCFTVTVELTQSTGEQLRWQIVRRYADFEALHRAVTKKVRAAATSGTNGQRASTTGTQQVKQLAPRQPLSVPMTTLPSSVPHAPAPLSRDGIEAADRVRPPLLPPLSEDSPLSSSSPAVAARSTSTGSTATSAPISSASSARLVLLLRAFVRSAAIWAAAGEDLAAFLDVSPDDAAAAVLASQEVGADGTVGRLIAALRVARIASVQRVITEISARSTAATTPAAALVAARSPATALVTASVAAIPVAVAPAGALSSLSNGAVHHSPPRSLATEIVPPASSVASHVVPDVTHRRLASGDVAAALTTRLRHVEADLLQRRYVGPHETPTPLSASDTVEILPHGQFAQLNSTGNFSVHKGVLSPPPSNSGDTAAAPPKAKALSLYDASARAYLAQFVPVSAAARGAERAPYRPGTATSVVPFPDLTPAEVTDMLDAVYSGPITVWEAGTSGHDTVQAGADAGDTLWLQQLQLGLNSFTQAMSGWHAALVDATAVLPSPVAAGHGPAAVGGVRWQYSSRISQPRASPTSPESEAPFANAQRRVIGGIDCESSIMAAASLRLLSDPRSAALLLVPSARATDAGALAAVTGAAAAGAVGRVGVGMSSLEQWIDNLLADLQPTDAEHARRAQIISFIQDAVRSAIPGTEAFVVGSFATRAYLPTSDIDLTLFAPALPQSSITAAQATQAAQPLPPPLPPSQQQQQQQQQQDELAAAWYFRLATALAARAVTKPTLRALPVAIVPDTANNEPRRAAGEMTVSSSPQGTEEQQQPAVRDVQFVNADVRIVRATMENGIVVDISANAIGAVAAAAFVEAADVTIGHDHLFKRSFMLLKAWLTFDALDVVAAVESEAGTAVEDGSAPGRGRGSESRSLGEPRVALLEAASGGLPPYALAILLFAVFNAGPRVPRHPLQALVSFFEAYATFPWGTAVVTIYGPRHLYLTAAAAAAMESSAAGVPHSTATFAGEGCFFGSPHPACPRFMSHQDTLRFSLLVAGCMPSAPSMRFEPRNVNIEDPCAPWNNLGRAASRAGVAALSAALQAGRSRLRAVVTLARAATAIAAQSDTTIARLGGAGSPLQPSGVHALQAALGGITGLFSGTLARARPSTRIGRGNSSVQGGGPTDDVGNMDGTAVLNGDGAALNFAAAYGAQALAPVLPATGIAAHLVELLTQHGPVSLGALGKLVQQSLAHQDVDLPAVTRSRFGGLKRFLFTVGADVFVIGDDHDFNPLVRLAFSP